MYMLRDKQRTLSLYLSYNLVSQVNAVDSDINIFIFQGGGSTAQKYLDKFMKAIESYFHPANFGRWLVKLKDLLRKLPHCFIQRLHTLVEWKSYCPLVFISQIHFHSYFFL